MSVVTEKPSLESAHGRMDLHGHIPALDGLRGLAALMVMVFHFQFPAMHNSVAQLAADRFRTLGQTGVDLFFVLSGFLITGILLDAKGGPNFLRNFYMRRVLRIFPLYYGTLLVYFFVWPLILRSIFDGRSFLIYGLYLQSLMPGEGQAFGIRVQGPGHFWSLAVEEHFYLIWPMLVYFLSGWRLRVALVGIIAASIATRAVLVANDIPVFFLTPCRFDAIALGSLLAVLLRDPRWEGWLRRNALRGFLIITAVFCPVYIVMSGSGNHLQQVYKFTVIAVFYAAFLLIAIEDSSKHPVGRILCSRALRSVGKYSYGTYVYHAFVFGGIHYYMGPWRAGLSGWRLAGLASLELALAFGATFASAWLSWHLYEKQFLKLKRFFEYGQGRKKTGTGDSEQPAGASGKGN